MWAGLEGESREESIAVVWVAFAHQYSIKILTRAVRESGASLRTLGAALLRRRAYRRHPLLPDSAVVEVD